MKTLYHRTTEKALEQIISSGVIKAQFPQHIGGHSVNDIHNEILKACCGWLLKKVESNKRVLWLLHDKDKKLAGPFANFVIEIHIDDCDYAKYVHKPRSLSGLISCIRGKLSRTEVLCINENLIIKSFKYKDNNQEHLIVEVTVEVTNC